MKRDRCHTLRMCVASSSVASSLSMKPRNVDDGQHIRALFSGPVKLARPCVVAECALQSIIEADDGPSSLAGHLAQNLGCI